MSDSGISTYDEPFFPVAWSKLAQYSHLNYKFVSLYEIPDMFVQDSSFYSSFCQAVVFCGIHRATINVQRWADLYNELMSLVYLYDCSYTCE